MLINAQLFLCRLDMGYFSHSKLLCVQVQVSLCVQVQVSLCVQVPVSSS